MHLTTCVREARCYRLGQILKDAHRLVQSAMGGDGREEHQADGMEGAGTPKHEWELGPESSRSWVWRTLTEACPSVQRLSCPSLPTSPLPRGPSTLICLFILKTHFAFLESSCSPSTLQFKFSCCFFPHSLESSYFMSPLYKWIIVTMVMMMVMVVMMTVMMLTMMLTMKGYFVSPLPEDGTSVNICSWSERHPLRKEQRDVDTSWGVAAIPKA